LNKVLQTAKTMTLTMNKKISLALLLVFFSVSGLKADWILEEMEVSENFRATTSNRPMVIDQHNTYHLVYHKEISSWNRDLPGNKNYDGVYYTKLACGQTWTEPELISPDYHAPFSPEILITGEEKLFVGYLDMSSNTFFLLEKTGEGWTYQEVETEVTSDRISIVSDHNNVVHAAWFGWNDENQRKVFYANNESGSWEKTEIPETHPRPGSFPEIEVCPEGKLHILYPAFGNEMERIFAVASAHVQEPSGNWIINKFGYEDDKAERGFIQIVDGSPKVIISYMGQGLPHEEPLNIDFYSRGEEGWYGPIPVNHISSGEPRSFTADFDENVWVSYTETAAQGQFGTLVLSKKEADENSFEDFYFEETQGKLISNNFMAFDSEGNQIMVYYTHGASDLYVLRSGECTPPTFSVTFEITDEDNLPVENAMVTLGEIENEPGDYYFENMENGEYQYIILKEGFHSKEGQLTVSDEDVLLSISLEKDDVGVVTFMESEARVFPNPAGEWIRVESPYLISNINLIDMTGRTIQSFRPESKTTELNISQIAPGFYSLQIITDKGSDAKKIQITR